LENYSAHEFRSAEGDIQILPITNMKPVEILTGNYRKPILLKINDLHKYQIFNETGAFIEDTE
jgi:hypothetical protein